MSFSSSLASELAFMDDSNKQQEEDEDMLLACVLVGEYLEEKDERPKFLEKYLCALPGCITFALMSVVFV